MRFQLLEVQLLKRLNGDQGELGEPSIQRLVDALDTYIPEPAREIDKPFLMPVEGVFSIAGRGTVATGRIEAGKVKVGEEVELVGLHDTVKTTVTGVEMFRKLLNEGLAGDNVGFFFVVLKKKILNVVWLLQNQAVLNLIKNSVAKHIFCQKMKAEDIVRSLTDIVHNFTSEQQT